MAGISAIQRLLDNQLTSKFARSLKHSDLPEGWADNPEIVALAEDAYREAGTKSPFFKAWYKAKEKPKEYYHGTDADRIETFESGLESGKFNRREVGPSDGVWFADNTTNAKGYGYNVIPVYLNLENPLNLRSVAESKRIADALYQSSNAKKIQQGKLVDMGEEGKELQNEIIDQAKYEGFDGLVTNDWDRGDKYIAKVAFRPEQIKSTSNRGTFNPADPNIYKGLIPAVGAGGLLALMGAEEAEAASYQFPADKRGTVRYEAGLESPSVDPVDVLLAPIGAVGAGAKAAAMAAEPFVSYGMDKALEYISKLWGEE